jgi:hypothetical protein
LIDYYESSGEGLSHYVKILNQKPYAYGTHDAPHDIMVRELGSGKSRLDTAKGLGIRFRVAPKHDVEDGIEMVRNLLPKCWFDQVKCARGIRAMREYRKSKNEKMNVYSSTPLHDWTSNPADSFRYLAANYRDFSRIQDVSKMPRKAITEYDLYRHD